MEGAGALGEVHQLTRVITVRWAGYQAFRPARTVKQLPKGPVTRANLGIPYICISMGIPAIL